MVEIVKREFHGKVERIIISDLCTEHLGPQQHILSFQLYLRTFLENINTGQIWHKGLKECYL